jgi:membrane-associated phospholipid phosphatase
VRVPLFAALACFVALALTAVLALAVPAAHRPDASLLHAFMSFEGTRVREPLLLVISLCDPIPYAFAGLCLCAVAVAQGRWWRAGAVAALFAVTGIATQIAKHVLATGRYDAFLERFDGQIGSAAFPSGHATAAMTLALCAVLVAPRSWRTIAVVAGWAFAAAMGYALLVLSQHYPSDVLGGYLMAGMWTALALAGLHAIEKTPAHVRPWWPNRDLALGVLTGAALSAAAVLWAQRSAVTLFPVDRPTLAIGAMAIAARAGALAAMLARAA